MKAIIFDTETTSTDEPEIIEAAWLEIESPLKAGQTYCERFRPSKPIQLGAMAAHHIMDEDLIDCRPSSEFEFPECDFLIGHNIDFDWQVAGSPDVKRICTLALARKVWPEADSHTQSALLYLIDRKNARDVLKCAHSAATDVMICFQILQAIIAKIEVKGWLDLWNQSEAARVPEIMTFGKHKGLPMAEVPRDYKAWLLRQPDVDPYLRKALEKPDRPGPPNHRRPEQ